ncbi:nucleotide kinase domain-containing protein [Blastococcus sp. SYSU DS1021]
MVTVLPGPVFDSYWRFAAERHELYLRRLRGEAPPWTDDAVLASWRFTNVYRAADRVSQYLLRDVIYSGDQNRDEVVFRVLLFKWFNRISTWELLTDRLGPLRLATFDPMAAERVLDQARASGGRIYSAAYIVPPVPGEPGPKHAGHLRLTMTMLEAGLGDHLVAAGSLEEVYRSFTAWPGVGAFLGYQMAIDLNYSAVIDHDEDDFVVAGPGALDGLAKAWPGADLRQAADLIRLTARRQDEHFARLGLRFPGLFGRRLKLIDCQNLYCEISKYSRVAHPEAVGVAGRTRIKQAYRTRPLPQPLPRPFFPPKWRLQVPDSYGISPNTEPETLTLDFPQPAEPPVRGR